jgi:hypothetical protein
MALLTILSTKIVRNCGELSSNYVDESCHNFRLGKFSFKEQALGMRSASLLTILSTDYVRNLETAAWAPGPVARFLNMP